MVSDERLEEFIESELKSFSEWLVTANKVGLGSIAIDEARIDHEDMMSALTELRERRRVERAVEETLESMHDGFMARIELRGCWATLMSDGGSKIIRHESADSWYAALAALVGEEPAKERKEAT